MKEYFVTPIVRVEVEQPAFFLNPLDRELTPDEIEHILTHGEIEGSEVEVDWEAWRSSVSDYHRIMAIEDSDQNTIWTREG